MKLFTQLWLVSCALASTIPHNEPALEKRVTRSGTATVTMSSPSGKASQLAAGWLNGIPPNGYSSYVAGTPPSTAAVQTQIPDYLISGLGPKNLRGGAANLPAPSRGWQFGLAEYENKFRAWHSIYLTARKFGANYTMMISDIWSTLNSSSPLPGANGDWTSWDDFITQLCSDLKSNDLTTGLLMEVWNEPNLQLPDVTTFVNIYGRTYHKIRSLLPDVWIVGPAYSKPPSTGSTWFETFMSFIGGNGSVPDAYTWHELDTGVDPLAYPTPFNTLLSNNGLSSAPIYVNEYGPTTEQTPSYSAWFISRFERIGYHALRADWESKTTTTSDLLADTLVKSGTSYSPNGVWWMYSYYANMTGTRLATTASADGGFDVYAVTGGTKGSTKILTGSPGSVNPYLIEIPGMSGAGYTASEVVTITVKQFSWAGASTAEPSPGVYGVVTSTVTSGTLTIGTTASSTDVAYAFEF